MTTKKSVLMEEDGFQLIAQPGEYWVSWIAHKDCSGEKAIAASAPWRWVDAFDGHCTYCPRLVPESLLGAWKLHNYDEYAKALRIRSNQENFC